MVDLRRFLLKMIYALKLAGSRILIWRNRSVNISDNLSIKEEIKVGSKPLSSSFTISIILVSSAFRELSIRIKDLPEFERGQLEPLSKKLQDLHIEISKLIERFTKIDKSLLSKEEQKILWELDNLANSLRVNLLFDEFGYKLRTKPTLSKSSNIDSSLLEEVDTLLKNMTEILDSCREAFRSKVSWLQMQQMIRSSGISEKLNFILIGLTVSLVFLTLILAYDIILRRVYQL